jgi:hypothetical protein
MYGHLRKKESLIFCKVERALLPKIGLKPLICLVEPRNDGLSYREYEIMLSRYAKS